MSVKIATTTKVIYPAVGDKKPVSYFKYDYFSCQTIDLFKAVRGTTEESECEGIYDYLNENGFWDSGHIEIEDEDEQWIEANPELHGLQDEVVVSVLVTTQDEYIVLEKYKG